MAEDTSQLLPERKMSWADMVDEEEELKLAQVEQRLQPVTRQDTKRKITPIPFLPTRTMGERRAQTKARHERSKASGTFPHPCTPPRSMDKEREHGDPPSRALPRSCAPPWFTDEKIPLMSRDDTSGRGRGLQRPSSQPTPSRRKDEKIMQPIWSNNSSRPIPNVIPATFMDEELVQPISTDDSSSSWSMDEDRFNLLSLHDDPPSQSLTHSFTPVCFKDKRVHPVSRQDTSSTTLHDASSNPAPSWSRSMDEGSEEGIEFIYSGDDLPRKPHPRSNTPLWFMDEGSEESIEFIYRRDDPPSKSRPLSSTPECFKDEKIMQPIWSNNSSRPIPNVIPATFMDEEVVQPVSRDGTSSRALHDSTLHPTPSRRKDVKIQLMSRDDTSGRGLERPYSQPSPSRRKDDKIMQPIWSNNSSRPIPNVIPATFMDEEVVQPVSRDGTSSRALHDSTLHPTPSRRKDVKIQLMSRDDTSGRGLERAYSQPSPSRRKDEKIMQPIWSNNSSRPIPNVIPATFMDEEVVQPVSRDGTSSRALHDSTLHPTPSRRKDVKIQLMSRDDTSGRGLERPYSQPSPSRRKDEKIMQPIWSNNSSRPIPNVIPATFMDEELVQPVSRDGTSSRALHDSTSHPIPSRRMDEKIQLLSRDDTSGRDLERPYSQPTPSRRKDEKIIQPIWSSNTSRPIPPVIPARIMDEEVVEPVSRDGTSSRALQDSTSNPTPYRRKDEKRVQLVSREWTPSRALQDSTSHPTPYRRKDEKMVQLVSRDGTSSRALQDSTSNRTPSRRKDEKMVQLVSREWTSSRALRDSTSNPTPSRCKDEKMVQLVSRDGTSSRALQDSTSNRTPSRRKDEKMVQLVSSRVWTPSRARHDSTSNRTPSRRKDEKIVQRVSRDGPSSGALQDSTLNPTPSRREDEKRVQPVSIHDASSKALPCSYAPASSMVDSVEVPSLAHSSQEKGASVKISYSKVLQAKPVKQPAVVSYTPPLSSDHRSQAKEAFKEPSCSMSVHGSSVGAPSSAIEGFRMASAPRQMGKFHGGSPQIVKWSGQRKQTVPQKYPTIPLGSKDGQVQKSPEPQEVQVAVESSPSTSVPLPKGGKEEKSQEPSEEQSAVEPSPTSSGAIPKATGRSARISKRGGRPRRSALLDTPSSAPGCMDGQVQKSPEPQEVQVAVESSPSTSVPLTKDGKEEKSQEPSEEQSAVEPSPTSSGAIPKDGKEEKSQEPSEEQSAVEPSPTSSGAIPKDGKEEKSQEPSEEQSAVEPSPTSFGAIPKDGKEEKSQEPSEEQSAVEPSPTSSGAVPKVGKEEKSQEPSEEQSAVEPSPTSSGAIPKATGSSRRILKRGSRQRRSALHDASNTASVCMDGKVGKSQEPQEERSAVEPSPSTYAAFPKVVRQAFEEILLSIIDGKVGKSQEPNEEQSAVEPSPSTSGAIPKATGSSVQILKRDDRPRRSPLLDSPNSLAEYLAVLMGGPSTSSDANRFTWGNVEEQVSIMSILKGELHNIQSFREDLKTIADDKESFYARINERLKDALVIFDTHKEIAVREDKVAYWKTRGLVFMESPQYAQFAVDAFTKAVKLDPSAVDCWNHLGDCYSSLADYEMSRKCFLSALEQERNVVSLQNLSILSRLKKPREREDYLAGINYAKEALSIDFTSTKSWSTLGNAYMAGFFAAGQDEQYMKKAVHSYRQAEKLGNQDIDLCLNKFVALKYLELYDEALKTVVPSLTKFSVEWKDVQTKFMGLMQYLNSVQELVTKKGKVRPKKRSEHIKRLLAAKPSEEERTAQTTPFPRLSGVVIWILTPDVTYPYTVGLLIDSDEVLVVTIFNLSRGKGFKIGDIINVPTDNKSEVEFCCCKHEFKFTKIRIFLPTDIILNGKRLSVKVLKPYEITSSEGEKNE